MSTVRVRGTPIRKKRRELHKGQQKCDFCVSVTIKDEKHRVVRVKRAFRERNQRERVECV